ncbi:MAG: hypothetical protein ACKVTZ_03310 [Bacteroidia bacterium]
MKTKHILLFFFLFRVCLGFAQKTITLNHCKGALHTTVWADSFISLEIGSRSHTHFSAKKNTHLRINSHRAIERIELDMFKNSQGEFYPLAVIEANGQKKVSFSPAAHLGNRTLTGTIRVCIIFKKKKQKQGAYHLLVRCFKVTLVP